ncbi:WD40 repeat-like protein [Aureobasidium pullulans]|uniref:WD40 repeat-like protein n=1 Tax=Aureobasidium pullulans TaxID=5580 RepID=A0AB38LQP8_AURPU|nr:WD40 repeat-like protein [Aureobasidium pullulans]
MISQKLALLDNHSLKEATVDSYDERKNNQCLPGTRVDLLADIQDWSTSPHSKCIFWLNGIAGAGKSTISRSVAKQFNKTECLGANFFFKRGDGDRANAKKLFPTLARQLARHVPGILGKLLKVLETEPDIPSKSLREQFEKLIYQPLVSVQDNGAGTQTPVYVVVIDALDECNDASDIQTILKLIVLFNDLQKLKLRVFVTSRPELPIRHEFRDMQDNIRHVVILHDIPQKIIAHDIEAFFRSEFRELASTARNSDRKLLDWPGDESICKLVDMALPLFIFASTVCRFVKDPTRNPEHQLQAILKQSHRNSKLDATYRPVLEQMFLGRDKEDQRRWASDFRKIVSVIIIAFEPLSIASLESLLQPDDFDIRLILAALHSVLDISESKERPGMIPIHDGDHIHIFLSQHMLHWLEALALMGDLAMSIEMLDTLYLLAEGAEGTQIRAFVHDAKRFVLRNQYIIDKSPLQMYYSALMFSPTRSIIRQKFWRGVEWLKVAPVVEDSWDACLQTLEGHSADVIAVCFSTDGKLLASASADEIRLWDTRTGVTHSVIRDDLYVATAITFSPDNRLIGSAHLDGTVKLRDLGTQEVCKMFTGHSKKVNAITFFSNGELLASASDDHTVRIWDTATGLTLFLLQGHTDYVEILAASQDGKYVASGSRDGKIRLWDALAGELRCVFKDDSTRVTAIAFMHDDTTIASADENGCISFWEVSTGALRNKLNTGATAYRPSFSPDGGLFAVTPERGQIKLFDTVTGLLHSVFMGHGDLSLALEFSPDNTVLASGSYDTKVKLWDVSTMSNHDIVKGGRSAKDFPLDELVTLSQADSIGPLSIHNGRLSLRGRPVAFSKNRDLVACTLLNHTINLHNLETRAPPLMLDGHADRVYRLAFSPDNKLLASASSDQTLNLWDVDTGLLYRKFSCTNAISEVVFSPNGKLLAIVLMNDVVELWNIAMGNLDGATFHARSSAHNIAFSPDGNLLACMPGRRDNEGAYLWNTSTMDRIQLSNRGLHRLLFAFCPSSRLFAFVSRADAIEIWNLTSGAVNNMLGGDIKDEVKQVVFSPDGKLIASANYTNINLWDVESRTLVDSFAVTPYSPHIAVNLYGPHIKSLSFSQDGRHLRSNLGYHRLQANDPSCSDDRSFLSIRGDWIFFGTTPILWLPTDFRPSTDCDCSVGLATVAFVRPTGQALIMTFDMTELERLFPR